MASEINSSWLIGSFALASNATLVVNGNNRTIPAGPWYLTDATAGVSLLTKVQTEIAAVVGGSTVVVCKDRKVRILSGGGALTLSIPASLQAVLGMVGSPTVGTTIVADYVSTLLWSPGWPETSNGHPVDSDGYDVTDRVVSVSPSGLSANVVQHTTQRQAAWSWYYVKRSRSWLTKAPGEFVRFRADVLEPGFRFKLYSNVGEDETSSSAATLPTAFGPYLAVELDPRWYVRAETSTDALGASFGLSAIKTSDLS